MSADRALSDLQVSAEHAPNVEEWVIPFLTVLLGLDSDIDGLLQTIHDRLAEHPAAEGLPDLRAAIGTALQARKEAKQSLRGACRIGFRIEKQCWEKRRRRRPGEHYVATNAID
ncbi:hypothetical protein [Arthrobacter sp. 92]|uniref:hypothetical protein n=1 Tax=Arthrobacter sp. 92 TaxID=3418175 RepID=UPI003CFFC7E5